MHYKKDLISKFVHQIVSLIMVFVACPILLLAAKEPQAFVTQQIDGEAGALHIDSLQPILLYDGNQIILNESPPNSIKYPTVDIDKPFDIGIETAKIIGSQKISAYLNTDVRLLSFIPLVDVYENIVAYDIDFSLSSYKGVSYGEIANEWFQYCKTLKNSPLADIQGKNENINSLSDYTVDSNSLKSVFGSVTISATFDRNTIISYYNGPSNFYSGGWIANYIAKEFLSDPDPILLKIYLTGPLSRSYLYKSGKEYVVIEGQEPYSIYNYEEFHETTLRLQRQRKQEIEQILINNGLTLQRVEDSIRQYNEIRFRGLEFNQLQSQKASHYVVGYSGYFEPLEWHYGCAPTAGAMVFHYWENRSWYGLLNYYYYREYDSIEGDGTDCHVAESQDALRLAMGTNSSGGTSPSNIYSGMLNRANGQGYNFSGGPNWTGSVLDWQWDKIVPEIDDGYPFVWTLDWFPGSSGRHSVTAVGYTDDEEVICHSTWWTNGDSPIFVPHSGGIVDFSFGAAPHPGGPVYYDAKLISPDGNTSFLGCSYSETFTGGSTMPIRWSNFGTPGNHVNLFYSTDGGNTYKTIINTADDGAYDWNIPCNINSQQCRIAIQQYSTSSNLVSSDGSWGDFRIIPGDPPPSPSPVSATDAAYCDRVVISWNNVSNEDGYYIYRGGTQIGTAGVNVTSYTDYPGTGTFSYCVIAYNECGSSSSACDNGSRKTVPDKVPNVTATDGDCDEVCIFWGNVSNEDGYYVYRNGTLINTVSTNVTECCDGGGNPYTTYSYTVRAFNSCGNGSLSDPDQGHYIEVPGAPGNLLASDNQYCNYVHITWNNVDHEDSYRVYRDGNWIGGDLSANTTSYDDYPGDCVSHDYSVRARNECGNGPFSNHDQGEPICAPDKVTGVTTNDGCGEVEICWNSMANTSGYRIYRNGLQVGTTSSTCFSDIYNPGCYDYTVQAYNDCGGGFLSDPPVEGCSIGPVSQVQNVSATDDHCGEVIITWDDLPNESNYYVYREQTQVCQVGADVTSCTDNPADGCYNYTVRAYNACGFGPYSAPDQGCSIPLVAKVTNVSASDDLCGEISITWDDIQNENGYIIYRDGSTIDSVGGNVTIFTESISGGCFSYTIAGYNECGNGPLSDSDQGCSNELVTKVNNVNASIDNCGEVLITWDDVDGEDGYRVFRNGEQIDGDIDSGETSFVDNPPDCPACYYYSVLGFNACGEGPKSDSTEGCCNAGPDQVQNVNATDDRCGEVEITWDDVDGEEGYRVYRDDIEIYTAGPDTTIFVDNPSYGCYVYYVQAYHSCGSGQISEGDPGCSYDPVAQIQNVLASNNLTGQILISWDDILGEDGYKIYRNGIQIGGNLDSNITEYTDTPPTCANCYAYTVAGYNIACGDGPLSDLDSGCCENGQVLDYIAIEGDTIIDENSIVSYDCRAYYNDSSDSLLDPCIVVWGDNCNYGNIDGCGSLSTYQVDDTEYCFIFASYIESSITKDTILNILIIPVESCNDIYVSTSGSDLTGDGSEMNPYQTVQYAIDVSNTCDTIYVMPGTYTERFMILGKSPAIISTSGPDSTFLTAVADRRVITISDGPDTVSIAGFDISGGVSLGDTLGDWGAGILTYNTNLKIDNCVIHDNIDDTAYTAYDGGGGIFAYNSYLSVENCEIYNNSAAYSAGGGIYFKAGSYGSIKHNYIHDNFGSFGGGIMASTGATGGDIEFNVICNNISSNDGGGIYLYDSAVTGVSYNITNNTITNNIAAYSGTGINAIMVGINGIQNVVAYNCVFEPDQAVDAGNVCLFDCGSIIWNCNDVFSDISPDPCNIPLYCGLETIPDGNISENPLFCDESCGLENLHLSANSPCAADNPLNPCGGLIGALPVDSSCGAELDYIVIEGPDEIPESSTVQYQCHAYYTDNSDRTINSCEVIWLDDCLSYGEIDNCGEFTAFDVLDTVSCHISVEYTENEITKDTVLSIIIYEPPAETCCIEVAEVAGAIGMPVGVPILAKCEMPGVAGVEFHADYDASVIQCDSIVSDNFDAPTANCEDEALHFIWEDFMNPIDIFPDDTLMVLWFTCVGYINDTGWIEPWITNELVDSIGDPIAGITFCDGFAYIPPCNDISGNIVYYDSVTAIPDVSVELYWNQSGLDSTDTYGDYHFECLDPGDYMSLPSRISDDPGVSVSDIIKIRRLLAHIEPFDNLYKCIAADVNCDCRISVADVIKLRRYLAHIEDIECGNWKFVDADYIMACDGYCTDFDDYCPFPESIFVSISGQDIFDADFIGIRIGDVNNTWSPTAAAKLSDALSKKLEIEDVLSAPGEIIAMPIVITDNIDLAGIEMHLNYDPDQLNFIGVQSELPGEITFGSNDESIHIVWEDINRTIKTSIEEPLLVLKFKVGDNFKSETSVNITGAEIVDVEGQPYNLEFRNGIIVKRDFAPEKTIMPKEYCLEQNRPNPFNPITEIRFGLPEPCDVSLEIFNIMGQKVKTLVEGHLDAGFHSYSWDASGYSSGIYFTRLKAGSFTDTKKMILLK